MKHTPEPWYAAEVHGGLEIRCLRDDDDPQSEEVIADIRFGDTEPEAVARANAAALSAALDLLAALERTLSWLTSYPGSGLYSSVYNQARAAIAKARGEG